MDSKEEVKGQKEKEREREQAGDCIKARGPVVRLGFVGNLVQALMKHSSETRRAACKHTNLWSNRSRGASSFLPLPCMSLCCGLDTVIEREKTLAKL